MSFVDNSDDPFSVAAKRIRSSVIRPNSAPQLPIQGQQQPTTYIIEPDLMETQTGNQHLPNDVAFDDAGFAYNTITGNPVQIVRRPNVLPVAKTPDGLVPVMPKMLDIMGNVMSPLAAGRVPVKAGEVVLGSGAVRTMPEILMRAKDAQIGEESLQQLSKPNHYYRAMTHDEYEATIGSGKGIKSNQSHSVRNEGTSFAEDAPTAESYSNFGRTDPRKTGNPTYLVEVKGQEGLIRTKDGYLKAAEEIPKDRITNVIKMEDKDGAIVGKTLLSDTRPQVAAAIGHSLEKQNQPFYSALERTVDTAKINKASPEQWLGYLKNQPGVKQEELAYVLGNLPEGPISKEALQDIVKGNKVELKEVVKGEGIKGEPLTPDSAGYDPDRIKTNAQTKYHDYQLPGGERYQEMLLTLPSRTQDGRNQFASLIEKYGLEEATKRIKDLPETKFGGDYKSSHWDEPNIVAHIRHNDRNIPDVGKSLHLEEVQSDWHQAGRKQGYKSDLKNKMSVKNEGGIWRVRDEAGQRVDLNGASGFSTEEQARNAIASNTRDIGGVPDAPFKKNWDELAFKRMLHKAAAEGYDSVSWTPGEAQAARYDLSKQVNLLSASKSGDKYLVYLEGKDGQPLFRRGDGWSDHGQKEMTAKELEDTVGKEVAKKVIEGKPNKEGWVDVRDKDLKIGGEGMKSFYDKMLVDKASSLIKKYGGKVEKKNVNGVEIPYIKLTPELKEKAKAGFPLFSSVPITVPVSHNPFASEEKKSYTLVPVNGNPFQ